VHKALADHAPVSWLYAKALHLVKQCFVLHDNHPDILPRAPAGEFPVVFGCCGKDICSCPPAGVKVQVGDFAPAFHGKPGCDRGIYA
jgi:hypothetical protein